jgi:hypothetical protein
VKVLGLKVNYERKEDITMEKINKGRKKRVKTKRRKKRVRIKRRKSKGRKKL